MAEHTKEIVPPFDFSEAEALDLDERISRCLDRARRIVVDNGYQAITQAPCVPDRGATETELAELESSLGLALPTQYRTFLSRCRYLLMDDGLEIGGFDHEGVQHPERPWVSARHRPGAPYLVFANYWRFADGDQLMFDLSDPSHPVVAYLHEGPPRFERYAPSFSLALWRLVHEVEDEEE